MCSRECIIDASETGIDDLVYQVVKFADKHACLPDSAYMMIDARQIPATHTINGVEHVIDQNNLLDKCVDNLNDKVVRTVEQSAYIIDDNSLWLDTLCEHPEVCETHACECCG